MAYISQIRSDGVDYNLVGAAYTVELNYSTILTKWNTEIHAGSASPAVTLPTPSNTTEITQEIRYTFTAASTNASFTAPSGYILGDSDGFAGLSAGNTLAYTDLTAGTVYEYSFAVLDSTHIALAKAEYATA